MYLQVSMLILCILGQSNKCNLKMTDTADQLPY